MTEQNAPQELDSLIDEIELRCDPEIGCAESRAFVFECAMLIKQHLPAIALPGLDLLHAPTPNPGKAEDLSRSLGDAIANQDGFRMSQITATGMMMSALCSIIHPHQREAASYFRGIVELVNSVEPQYTVCLDLVRKHFPSCLS